MKNRLLLFFIFYWGCVASQSRMLMINPDSELETLDSGWLYTPQDDTAMALKEYDDSNWKTINPDMYMVSDTALGDFKGIGWFRLHVYADKSIVEVPVAILMEHPGASEIYLDGKLLIKNGVIADKEKCVYYNPKNDPLVFIIQDTGKHVFAVRYANYNAEHNKKLYRYRQAGFKFVFGSSKDALQSIKGVSYVGNISMFLFSLFASIALIHFLLFLYHRVTLSNLYFSILALSTALLFLHSFIMINSGNANLQIISRYLSAVITCVITFSFSAVINTVFPEKNKWRFWTIAVLCLFVIFVTLFNWPFFNLSIVILIALVSVEVIVKIIIALVKKQKGSRIIGTGFFFVVFFVLTIILIILLSNGKMDINDDTPVGQLLLLFLIFSVLCIPFSMSLYLAKNFATINKDLNKQLDHVKVLSAKTLEQEQEKKRLLENKKEELEKEVQLRTAEVITQKEKIEKQHHELILEKKKSDDLLLNILPAEVAEELKQKGTSEARYFTDVTVLFTDFVNFTKVSEQLSPQQLVSEIHDYFRAFDDIISHYGLEKIKTIGDAYLAVCGLPEPNLNHAKNAVRASIAIRDYIIQRKEKGGLFEIRIGLNSGAVVAGIVGVKKFAYDIWGDTVNTANRMEQSGEPGKINISGSTYALVKDDFECISRGKIDAKNKGMIDMYFVEGEGGSAN